MAENQHPALVRVHTAIFGLSAVFVIVGFVALAKTANSDDYSTPWTGVLLVCLVALVVVLPTLTWLINRWWPDPFAVDETENRDRTSD